MGCASLPLLIFIIILINLYNSLSINFIFFNSLLFSYNIYIIIIVISFIVKFPIFFFLYGGRILRIVCLINSDIKVIIAYSSVVHIALIIILNSIRSILLMLILVISFFSAPYR